MVVTVTATMAAVLTTALHAATFAMSHPALISAQRLLTLGTVAITALPLGKTPVRMAHVKAVAGKTVVVTTATPPVRPHAAQPVTSSPAAPSTLAPATSNPTLRAKALQASVAEHAC